MNATKDAMPERSKLQRARRAAGLTVEQLAVKAGVSYSTVNNMDRGTRVSKATLERIALALGVKPSSLQ
jgi:transcriptional regulator with XRE-family HTH domain